MLFERDFTIYIETKEESLALADYNRDDVNFSLLSTQFFYVGLYKPFSQLYFELPTPDVNGVALTAEYWDGSAFVALEFFDDSTLNWSRSGFQKWKKSEDWDVTTINSDELYWVRLSPDIDTSAIDIRGCNVLFSDDNKLKTEESSVDRFLPQGETSFVSIHQASRDKIVSTLRNKGLATRKNGADLINDITRFDILDAEQVERAATYFALSQILYNASDDVGDKFMQRSTMYGAEANTLLNLYWLSIDSNDDGIEDTGENLGTTVIEVQRI